MNFYKVNLRCANEIFLKLGCEPAGASILAQKSEIIFIYIKNMHVGAANILKQDALSIGADVALPKGAIIAENKFVDAILLANKRQIKILIQKEKKQPFELKDFGEDLKQFLNPKSFDTRIMGVLNANEDSFFKDSRFCAKTASKRIENMIKDGADIIDIGAVSSRPGSTFINKDEEFKRLKEIIDIIYKEKFYEKACFSLDSFRTSILQYALDNGFSMINDITGLKDLGVANLASKYKASLVIMHMQNNPETMQNNPEYENIILDINEFFKQKIKLANSCGVQDIILDVGIGFGKNLEHNLELISNLNHFEHFGYELLIGASRKSMINDIITSKIEDRLAGSLAVHLQAVQNGASIIRCHDVKEQSQALRVQDALLSHKIL